MEYIESLMKILDTLGIQSIFAVLLGWVGKRYLDGKLENEKSEHEANIKSIESKLNHYLEVHKQKIKNSEFFFQKQYEASQDLYRIKVNMLPPFRHPDMDWHEALEEMSEKLEGTRNELQALLDKYFSVLSPDLVEKLESAMSSSDEGKFYARVDHGMQCADSTYNKIKECSSLLKAEVDGQRL